MRRAFAGEREDSARFDHRPSHATQEAPQRAPEGQGGVSGNHPRLPVDSGPCGPSHAVCGGDRDALLIEARAKARLAAEYDHAQERERPKVGAPPLSLWSPPRPTGEVRPLSVLEVGLGDRGDPDGLDMLVLGQPGFTGGMVPAVFGRGAPI